MEHVLIQRGFSERERWRHRWVVLVLVVKCRACQASAAGFVAAIGRKTSMAVDGRLGEATVPIEGSRTV